MTPGSRENLSGIAIDFGGTKTAAARFDKGEVVALKQSATSGSLGVDALVQSLVELARAMEVTGEEIVGVGVTGRVDSSGNWYAVNQSTLSQIDRVPLQALLSRQLGRSISVVNDALAGAMAEHCFGAGTKCSRLAYLTVSTGVGAGIVLDGVPFKSPRGLAGHAGFTSSRFATGRCGSGRIATVESVASGTAIARAAHVAGYPNLNAENVFSAHRANEPWAGSIIEQSVSAIAELCADLVALLDIERVVLGGGVGLAEGYCDGVQQAVSSMPALFQVPVVRASMGAHSVLYGALTDAHRCHSLGGKRD